MTATGSRVVPWSEPWLWDLRPGRSSADGGPTVVFLPHAGGSAAGFVDWAAAVPAGLRTLAAQYPGRGPRFGEPNAEQVSALAGPLAAALAPVDGPLIVVGHSLGAIVGYEVGWLLQRRGRPLDGLVASAARAPVAPTLFRHRDGLPPDTELVDLLERSGGLPADVIRNEEMLALVLDVVRADLALVERYDHGGTARRLDCPISVVGGLDDPLVPIDLLERWRECAGGEFALRTVPGGHFAAAEHPGLLDDLVSGLAYASTTPGKAAARWELPR